MYLFPSKPNTYMKFGFRNSGIRFFLRSTIEMVQVGPGVEPQITNPKHQTAALRIIWKLNGHDWVYPGTLKS